MNFSFKILVFIICFISCDVIPENQMPLYVYGASDKRELPFCTVLVFKNNKQVIETSTDIDAKYMVERDVVKLILVNTGYYPRYVFKDDLKKDSIIFLDESKIMIATGGMGVDDSLNSLYEHIIADTSSWNGNVPR